MSDAAIMVGDVCREHVDLFAGIGGFSLAASWCGVRTVAHVEINKRCRAFLSRAWPETEKHDDIRTFDGSRYAGAWLLTAGVPCQPASRAGQQRGAADDRWLWPEAVRVLGQVRPAWALFENPPGIGDVGLAGILAGVEVLGYEVRVFGIQACAVGSPQRRERYWIVCRPMGDATGQPHGRARGGQSAEQRDAVLGGAGCGVMADAERSERRSPAKRGNDADGDDAGREEAAGRDSQRTQGDMADAEGPEHDGQRAEQDGAPAGFADSGHWDSFVWLPCADGKVRRAPDDSFGLVDGLHRSVLAALGNSIVPQVAERIIGAMIEAENSEAADGSPKRK